jgi:hypothetical protein
MKRKATTSSNADKEPLGKAKGKAKPRPSKKAKTGGTGVLVTWPDYFTSVRVPSVELFAECSQSDILGLV